MKKRFCLLLGSVVIFWLFLVFSQSMLPAEISDVQSDWVLTLLQQRIPVKLTVRVVRKGAHFLEFAVLGGLSVLGWRGECTWWRRLLIGTVTGMVCGVCDETLQLFSPGRSGNLADVWLDTSGAALGAMVVTIADKRFLCRKSKAETGG